MEVVFFQNPEQEFARVLREKLDQSPEPIPQHATWQERQKVFSGLLQSYFEMVMDESKGDLDLITKELLETSEALGHVGEGGSDTNHGGIRVSLIGDLAEKFSFEVPEDIGNIAVHIQENFEFPMMWYKSQSDRLMLTDSIGFKYSSSMRRAFRKSTQHYGSLHTTRLYPSSQEPYPLLDSFHAAVSEVLEHTSLILNQRLYIIPKFPTYTTSHHQDIHEPPHIVLYQHVQSSSVFYFLPVLFGLFGQHAAVTVNRNSFLQDFYSRCDELGVGTFGEITPGDILVVNPCVSHLVQVPEKNGSELTLVRAAEIFLP